MRGDAHRRAKTCRSSMCTLARSSASQRRISSRHLLSYSCMRTICFSRSGESDPMRARPNAVASRSTLRRPSSVKSPSYLALISRAPQRTTRDRVELSRRGGHHIRGSHSVARRHEHQQYLHHRRTGLHHLILPSERRRFECATSPGHGPRVSHPHW